MEYVDFRAEVRQLAPDLLDEVVDDSLEMAIHLSQNGLVSLRRRYGDARFDTIIVKRWSDAEYVVHDKETNLYMKSYDVARHATMQQHVMNELQRRLLVSDIGIQAVRHLAVIQPSDPMSHAVAVIETAPGQSVRARYPGRGQWAPIVQEVRSRLNETLGVGLRRVLVNDINRMHNAGANIIVDDVGVYRLIDQPFMANDASYRRMKFALSLLQRQTAAILDES